MAWSSWCVMTRQISHRCCVTPFRNGLDVIYRTLGSYANTISSNMRITNQLCSVTTGPKLDGGNRTYATLVNPESYFKRKEVLEMVNDEVVSQPSSKLFCVVFVAGKQHKVTVNDLLIVNSLEADLGSQIFLEKVLLVGSENFTLIGRPLVSSEAVKVTATVVEHTRLKKVVVFKKKRRKNYKRTKGHRQNVTVLRINDILVSPNLT